MSKQQKTEAAHCGFHSGKQHHPCSIPGRAEQAGVCIATIYNEINRGKLKGTKVGARTIILDEDWQEYLEAGKRQVKGAA